MDCVLCTSVSAKPSGGDADPDPTYLTADDGELDEANESGSATENMAFLRPGLSMFAETRMKFIGRTRGNGRRMLVNIRSTRLNVTRCKEVQMKL